MLRWVGRRGYLYMHVCIGVGGVCVQWACYRCYYCCVEGRMVFGIVLVW
jgi:hypothetical protein